MPAPWPSFSASEASPAARPPALCQPTLASPNQRIRAVIGWNGVAARVYSLLRATPEQRMNLFEEHAVRDYAAAAAQIPVIDFGPAFGGKPGALQSIAEAARHACENVGF